jgi:hypothetical protein
MWQNLFSVWKAGVYPPLARLLVINEIVKPLQRRLLRWCTHSGPGPTVIEELQNADRKMFQSFGLTLNSEDAGALHRVRHKYFLFLEFPYLRKVP